jgi:phytoene dehydrogenase-like protein
MTALDDIAGSARLLADKPAGRLPVLGIANYGAIESGLADGPPTLVSVVGLDHSSNWAGLPHEAELDRRERWLDAILGALDRTYPGFATSVTEKVLLTARSMHDFLNTPGGAIYGFAPRPPEQSFWAGLPRSSRTPIPGLYLASSFGGSGGFTGAMLSGADAARLAMAKAG